MKLFLRKLIIYLICKRLGIKRHQTFRFSNQKSESEYYWFTDTRLRKMREDSHEEDAHVSLNWLLHDECEVILCMAE